MKTQSKKSMLVVLLICVSLFLSGCGMMETTSPEPVPAPAVPLSPELVKDSSVMIYSLPFIYDEGKPQHEELILIIKEVIAPAHWENGPNQMRAVANMLIVRTTAQNHMRIERFFDSIPDIDTEHSEAWSEPHTKILEHENDMVEEPEDNSTEESANDSIDEPANDSTDEPENGPTEE